MRAFEPSLWPLGEASIAEGELDPGSRDDIPQLLRGLQHLYITPTLREEVFQILDDDSRGDRPEHRSSRDGLVADSGIRCAAVEFGLGL